MAEHSSPRVYLLSLLALLGLTGLSYYLSGVTLGDWEIVVALAIATVKGTIVALYFMHLLGSPSVAKIAMVTAVAFVVLLVAMLALDVLTREGPALVPPIAG